MEPDDYPSGAKAPKSAPLPEPKPLPEDIYDPKAPKDPMDGPPREQETRAPEEDHQKGNELKSGLPKADRPPKAVPIEEYHRHATGGPGVPPNLEGFDLIGHSQCRYVRGEHVAH